MNRTTNPWNMCVYVSLFITMFLFITTVYFSSRNLISGPYSSDSSFTFNFNAIKLDYNRNINIIIFIKCFQFANQTK